MKLWQKYLLHGCKRGDKVGIDSEVVCLGVNNMALVHMFYSLQFRTVDSLGKRVDHLIFLP
jgi:hypothetical protein